MGPTALKHYCWYLGMAGDAIPAALCAASASAVVAARARSAACCCMVGCFRGCICQQLMQLLCNVLWHTAQVTGACYYN